MMTRKVIVECIERQLFYKPIKIIFKRDGQVGFNTLVRLIACNKVNVQGTDRFKSVTMFNESLPNTDETRTIEVFNFRECDEESLLMIADDVQDISTSPHVASELFSIIHEPNYLHNPSYFKGGVEDFVKGVLNESILGLISSLGCSVTGHFVCFGSLPAIVFAITHNGGNFLVNVGIDFWSGRYSINGVWGQTTLKNKEDIRQRIYSATVDAIAALKSYTVAA